MSNVDKNVGKNIRSGLRKSPNNRIEACSVHELKVEVGAEHMRTSCLQRMLGEFKHQRVIRGFSLRGENVYIQA